MARLCTFTICLLLAGLALFPAGVAYAVSAGEPKSELLTLDPARSRAEFEARVMWLIGVHGRFGALHGTIGIDRFHGTASVNASINVNDVSMRSRDYEAWVKSAEFFDVEHYPQIQFVSDSFSLTRLEKGGEIEGLLTIRGVGKRVRFQIDTSECANEIARACPVAAEGTIRRSDFGMQSRRGALSDKVQLDFSIYVLPAAEVTP